MTLHRARLYAWIALGSILASTGCASYRHRVSDDFRDAIKLNVGFGFGLYAHAKATSFLDAGLGWGGYWQDFGLEDRYVTLLIRLEMDAPFQSVPFR